ncbi:MAG: hypothetical protein LVQ95_03470 [Candidatus Micrarchaeales archaeon]|nr:hypothetical protein [Candidatus Micrarchaeales archaeon]
MADNSNEQIVTMSQTEREQAINPQEIQPQERQGSSKVVQISAVLTAVIIMVFVFLMYRQSSGVSVNPSCGPGLSCMSRAEAIALLGAGGIYNSSSTTNPQVLDQQVLNNSGLPGATSQNYTEFWFSGYRLGNSSIIEYVLKTSKAEQAYAAETNRPQNPFHMGNFTANGTTYSSNAGATYGSMVYAVLSNRNDTNGETLINIVGYKNSEFAAIVAVGKSLSVQSLVNTLAVDMP